jgi:cytoskeletal protein RodZ
MIRSLYNFKERQMNDQQEKTKLWKIYGILMGVMVGGAVLILGGQALWNAIQQNMSKASRENKPPSTNSLPLTTPQVSAEVRSQTPSSAPLISTERVSFNEGSTGATIRDSLTGNQRKRYLLNCGSGQRMTVQIRQGDINVTIISPNNQTIGNAANGVSQWQGQLPNSGDYIVEISAPNQSGYVINIEVL